MSSTTSAGLAPSSAAQDKAPFAFTIAYIGIGANLGDARANVLDALARLQRQPGCTLMQASSLYRTAPIDSSGDDYINAVARLQTRLLISACRSNRFPVRLNKSLRNAQKQSACHSSVDYPILKSVVCSIKVRPR